MNVLDSLHEMMGGLNDRMRAMEDFAATQKRTTLTPSETQHETPLTPTTKTAETFNKHILPITFSELHLKEHVAVGRELTTVLLVSATAGSASPTRGARGSKLPIGN